MRRHLTVLLVEDDSLLAMDVERVLVDAGYRVIGPAGNTTHALSILRVEAPDLTILDINLHGQMAFPVFDYLESIGALFLIFSGHSREVVPTRHARRPFLQKPCDERTLLRAVQSSISGGQTTSAAIAKRA